MQFDRDAFAASTTLMVQGCTSDAGKSVMVAGLCRYLARKGVNVAPFKPQNMALNSAVTAQGGEIGRAQAVQAQACYLPPHTDFNPILLKPSSDTGAQVIVHGQALTAMEASRYHDYKKTAMQAVLESHQRLQQQYSAIMVEGAGSPAEINLRENDIANMGFAEAVDCPVVLIADIDRGGVFAHLVGTLELLSQSEQDRVIGFIINRFRGDLNLLTSGLEWLETRTNKKVFGVIPYLSNFYLDAEDAIVSSQLNNQLNDCLKIVVPVLKRISNHTDFDALRMHPDVELEFVSIDQPCPACDLIILPGSKNVIGDLTELFNAQWHTQINKHLRYGGKVIGICGGYQMLGRLIEDPDHIESRSDQAQGLGLLPISTKLMPQKQLTQTSARIVSEKFKTATIKGYEIHCGISKIIDKESHFNFTVMENGEPEGIVNQDSNVLGTYLHGLFDQPDACHSILAWAGLSSNQAPDLEELREQQLDRLADCLESHLDPELLTTLSAINNKSVLESQKSSNNIDKKSKFDTL